jgi:hypothetical protein
MAAVLDHARTALLAGLSARRDEIEEALLARIYGIEEPGGGVEVEYLHGLRETVSAAYDYALAALELGEDRMPPVPMVFLVQARLAARNGVPMDIVIRRYFSGFMLLANLVLEEAESNGSVRGSALRRLLASHGSQIDKLIEVIAEEFKREVASGLRSTQQRRTQRVQRVLAGEDLDLGEFGYELDDWHLALVIKDETQDLLQQLVEGLEGRLLWVHPQTSVTWVWLGGRRRLESAEIAERVRLSVRPGDRVAVGEPARGIAGWRLSHNQAKAAFPIADGDGKAVVRYSDVGLVSCLLRDKVLTTSLRQTYILPLADERDEGKALRDTLRAYFEAGRNISSAAAALGLNRQTVRIRLRTIEEKVGYPLDRYAAEVELALRLELYRPGHRPVDGA